MTKTVALYARYSSDKQSERSASDQLRDCATFAQQQGWTISTRYYDAAISGTVRSRPQYLQLLDDIQRHSVDVVLAENMDRFSRDQEETARLYKVCAYHDVELWTLTGPVTEIDVGFRGVMSALYLRDLAQRTRRGLNTVLADGRSAGGKAYGYRSTAPIGADGKPKPGVFQIDEGQARWVRWIFQRYAEGRSCAQIAAELNNRDVPGPSGRSWKDTTINGNRANGTGILNNDLYIGIRVWGRRNWRRDPSTGKRRPFLNPQDQWRVIEVPQLRIVPDELWNAVKGRQARLDARMAEQEAACEGDAGKRQGIGAARNNIKLLTPILRCGECGAKMTHGSADYVACQQAKQTGGSACANTRMYRRTAIEERLLNALRSELMSEEALGAFFDAYNSEIERRNADAAAERRRTKKELQSIEAKISKLVDAIADGYAHTSVKEKLDALEAQKSELQTEMADPAPEPYAAHPEAGQMYREHIKALGDALSDPETSVQARDAILGLLDAVRLIPRPDREKHAFDLDVSGTLADMLHAAGIKKRDAAQIDATSRSSGQLVAGVGFEPTTFRL